MDRKQGKREKVKAWISNPSLNSILAILLFRKQDRKLLSKNSCFWRSRTLEMEKKRIDS